MNAEKMTFIVQLPKTMRRDVERVAEQEGLSPGKLIKTIVMLFFFKAREEENNE